MQPQDIDHLLAGITPASVPPAKIAALYDRRAPFYDRWAGLFEREAQRRTLELACLADGDRALVVGAGTGSSFVQLLRENRRGWTEGMDISPGMLRLAGARAWATGSDRWRLLRADARALPYVPGSFDLLLCSYLLDLLPTEDLLPVLAEFRRALHPMGQLVLTNMAPGTGLGGWFWQTLYGTSLSPSGDCRPLNATPLVEAAGFTVAAREIVVEHSFTSEVVVAYMT